MIINNSVIKTHSDCNVIDKFVIAQAIYAMSEGEQPDGCSNVLARCDTCQYGKICRRIDDAVKQTFEDYNKVVQTFSFENEDKEC